MLMDPNVTCAWHGRTAAVHWTRPWPRGMPASRSYSRSTPRNTTVRQFPGYTLVQCIDVFMSAPRRVSYSPVGLSHLMILITYLRVVSLPLSVCVCVGRFWPASSAVVAGGAGGRAVLRPIRAGRIRLRLHRTGTPFSQPHLVAVIFLTSVISLLLCTITLVCAKLCSLLTRSRPVIACPLEWVE